MEECNSCELDIECVYLACHGLEKFQATQYQVNYKMEQPTIITIYNNIGTEILQFVQNFQDITFLKEWNRIMRLMYFRKVSLKYCSKQSL